MKVSIVLIFFNIIFYTANCIAVSACSAAVSVPLQVINIIYYDGFPCSKINCQIPVPGCHKVLPFGHVLKKEAFLLQCAAHVKLLRSKSIIKQWRHSERLNGYFSFTLQELGVINVEAHIVNVKSLGLNSAMLKTGSRKAGVITGLFERKSINVRSYDFQSLQTGRISTVHVTANHRFYVKNRHAFIPITDISCQDKLLDVKGTEVHLVCSDKLLSHYDKKQSSDGESIISVYNLEVSGKHTYFAGKDNLLLVHNVYYEQCPLCEHIPLHNCEYEVHMRTVHGNNKPYICDNLGCEKSYLTEYGLEQHMIKKHSGTGDFACVDPHCKLKYRRYENIDELNLHMVKCHNGKFLVINSEEVKSDSFSEDLPGLISESNLGSYPEFEPMLTFSSELKLVFKPSSIPESIAELSSSKPVKSYSRRRFSPYEKLKK